MKFIYPSLIVLFTSIILFNLTPAYSQSLPLKLNPKYQAIVLGKITKKQVKNPGKFYITVYKLKVETWIYSNPNIKRKKYLTLKVLGADLPDKGLIVKASTTPDYIPMHKNVVFLLENTMKKEKNVFTVTQNGIIFEPDINKIRHQSNEVTKND